MKRQANKWVQATPAYAFLFALSPWPVAPEHERCMKQVRLSTREQWRKWLAENHDKEEHGIWLVFHRKQTASHSLECEESVEEALCFGWIDSIIKH